MANDKFTFEQFCEAINEFSPFMDDYPYVYDMKNDKYFISEKVLDRFALDSNLFNLIGREKIDFVYEDDIPFLLKDLQQIGLGLKDGHNLEYRWLDKNGQPVWIDCRGRVIREPDGSPKFMIGAINEIGNESRADNVSGFMQSTVMRELLEDSDVDFSADWVMRVGIDGFKNINETYGKEYGNKVIQLVSECIRRTVGDDQLVYHVEAEEFIVVDTQHDTAEEVMHELFRGIRNEIEKEIQNENYEVVYTISAGLISYRDLGRPSFADAMKYSEFALGEARSRGLNQYYVYAQSDYDEFLRKRKILVDMRKSIANGYEGFELVFQPIMTGGTESVHLYAAESLLRYTTYSGEHISPIEFIPILEESGLIIPVGKWIFDRAVSMCSECQKVYPEFKISINLSYVQIIKSSVLNEALRSIKKYGVAPESIIVELTESGYLEDTDEIRKIWKRLKEAGFLIALDDFGTGYSNLSSITTLTPDIIKIDRGFTVKALSNQYEEKLMSNIIDLVHSIDLKICLEGIETKENLDTLNKMNPNFIQGYYYSKPCSRMEFKNKFIEQNKL